MVVLSLLIPAAFNNLVGDQKEIHSSIMKLSHGTAIILLIVYVAYLIFQLKTHNHLFESEEAEEEDANMSLGVSIGWYSFCFYFYLF
ncbi:hypothetical protein DSO57_1030830 [Entomophthora muscae]|uniref:Uncharacterized protein n=1 Tax=Entomophthora muscae TaxID=34485 RepID=A0ACC2TC72_9FUNG|nr:hypothetical protein DSO57_1030830 [Entomophthora muscae]